MGDFFLLHDPQRGQTFAFSAKQVGHFLGYLDAGLIRASGKGIGVQLSQDFTERQVHQAGILRRGINEEPRGRSSTQFAEADFD